MKKEIKLFVLWVVCMGLLAFGVIMGSKNETPEYTPAPTATVTPAPTPTPKLKWLYEEYNEELEKAVKTGNAIENSGNYVRVNAKDLYTDEEEFNNDLKLWEEIQIQDNYLHEFDSYYKDYDAIKEQKTLLITLMQGMDMKYPHEITAKKTDKNKVYYEAVNKYFDTIESYALDLTQYAQFGSEYLESLKNRENELEIQRKAVAKQTVNYFLSRGSALMKIEY